MSNPNNVINTDIIKTIDSWIESLPYKKGSLVRCYYPDRMMPPRDLKIEELEISSACTSRVRVQLEGVKNCFGCPMWLDSAWVEVIKVKEELPYKVGDQVHFVGGQTPQRAVIDEIKGNEVRFRGAVQFVESQWVLPIKVETKEEPKAMIDIKWTPVDAYSDLPEGEVLAIQGKYITVGTLFFSGGYVCLEDREGEELGSVEAYIPIDHLKQLWVEQNPAAGYSKESEAYKLLRWIIESESDLGKALNEINIEAGHTIDILAQQMIRASAICTEAPCNPHVDSHDFLKELINWIKEYIAN